MNTRRLIFFFILAAGAVLTVSKASAAQEPLSNNQIDKTVGIEDYSPRAVLPPGYTLKEPADQQIKQEGLTTKLSAQNLPNIVFILVDDQPPGLMGAAGNTTVKMPNIDGLANSGIYFKNMYVPLGICAPSRASIWTGKYPHTNGVTKNGLILPPDQITLPEILKANGYSTGIIGKCHLGVPEDPEKYKRGFDLRLVSYPDAGSLSDWYNYQFSRNGIIETYANRYITNFLTDESINFIKSNAQTGRPFFLWLAHFAPHRPTIPPKGQNLYNKDTLPLPASITEDLSSKSPQVRDSNMHKTFLNLGISGVRQELDDAYEVMSNVDGNVGRVLQTLNDLGIKNKTIVIYMSDNGFFYGEHQLERKGPTFYQDQMKVPFIFSYPSVVPAQGASNALVSSVDILPTVLDFLKIPLPAGLQGQSFAGMLSSTSANTRQSAFFEFFENQATVYPNITWDPYPMRGVVSHNFKWIRYLASTVKGVAYGVEHEFYDLQNDPLELNNILRRIDSNDNPLMRMINDQKYGKMVRLLRKEMAVWQTQNNDPIKRNISGFQSSAGIDSLNLSWKTDLATTSEIEYKESSCATCALKEINDFSLVIDHRTAIPSLKPSTDYQIKVYSIGANGSGAYLEKIVKTKTLVVGDLNGDGKVDILDYNIFLANFGKTGTPGFIPSDIDKNGIVDIFDYNLLVENFEKSTTPIEL